MKHAALIAALAAVIATAIWWLHVQVAPIGAIVRGGDGALNLVLLHGYGSRAEDWLQFESRIQVPNNGRMIFPQGPLRGPWSGAHGWWWLNLEGHRSPGQKLPDLSTATPGGIKVASRLVRDYLRGVRGPIVLGGFSQGAMLSAEIAFQTDQELAALVMIGGTTLNEQGWLARLPGRRRLPVFIAHGRSDDVLPFAIAERFARKLEAAGLDVTWVPFDGGHGIAPVAIEKLNAFLLTLDRRAAGRAGSLEP